MEKAVQGDTYEHYKGARYELVGVGKNSETEKDVVIYRPLYESDVAYWVRPYDMFFESLDVDGVLIPRFKKIN